MRRRQSMEIKTVTKHISILFLRNFLKADIKAPFLVYNRDKIKKTRYFKKTTFFITVRLVRDCGTLIGKSTFDRKNKRTKHQLHKLPELVKVYINIKSNQRNQHCPEQFTYFK